MQTHVWSSENNRPLDGLAVEYEAMADKPKSVTWEWEDEETGEIRTFEIALPNLDIEDDSSEVREIILDRKLRLDRDQIPDWIEIMPERKPN
jgi:hypothetical protein